MRLTQSPTDALLTHLEIQRETQVWSIFGLEWSNHLDERLDQDKYRGKTIHMIHPTYYSTYLSQSQHWVHSPNLEQLCIVPYCAIECQFWISTFYN